MKKKISLVLLLVIVISMLSSCGAATKAENDAGGFFAPTSPYYDDSMKSEVAFTQGALDMASPEKAPVAEDRKQIKNVLLRLQTKEYDTFINSLIVSVEHYNGYISTQRESGNSYNEISNRYCYIIARIPAENLSEFCNGISDICNITYRNETVSDVTEAYVDVESRIAVLKAEESSLLAMLQNAQNHLSDEKLNYSEIVDTMMYIKDRLLSVQSDLASYEAQLKSMSSMVAYSTVTLEINEVERFVNAETKLGLWEEIGERLSDNLYYIGRGFRNFFVWLVISLPYFAIWGAVIAVVVIVVRKTVKHISKRDSELKAQKNKEKDKEDKIE